MDDVEFIYTLNEIKKTMENGELLNGRLAMLGVVAAVGSYVMTGQLIPGIY
jgi:Na+/H+ antiporter NhaA